MSLSIINNNGPPPTHITTPPLPQVLELCIILGTTTHNYYQHPTQVLPRTPLALLQVLELCIILGFLCAVTLLSTKTDHQPLSSIGIMYCIRFSLCRYIIINQN